MSLDYWTLHKAPPDSPKKWAVRVPTSSGRGKTVLFGARGYEDFTTHGDVERRARYRTRHQHDRIDDPTAPGFWSWWALWGESDDLKTAFAAAVRRAKKTRRNPSWGDDEEKDPRLFVGDFLEGSIYRERLFHGTNIYGLEGKQLRPDHPSSRLSADYGIYLTPKSKYAMQYGRHLYLVAVNFQEPLFIQSRTELPEVLGLSEDEASEMARRGYDLQRHDVRALQREGYDAIVMSNTHNIEGALEVVLFEPDQTLVMTMRW